MRALFLSLVLATLPFVAAAQTDAGVPSVDASIADGGPTADESVVDVDVDDDADADAVAEDANDADRDDADVADDADEVHDEDGDDAALDDETLDEEAPEPPHWTDERAGAWATFITSFLIGVGGGIMLAIGVDDVNTIENAASGATWSRVEEAYERAPILTGVGAGTLSLGAVGTLLGAILLGVYGEGGTWIAVSALPSGLRLSGTF